MNRRFFPKLAASNMRRNSRTYIPYIISSMVTVAVFYILKSLSANPDLEQMYGGNTLAYMMSFGSNIAGFFAFVFLFYTNSFLVKRRKKEFGLFHILGMEKLHLARTMAWETVYVALISIAGGLILGIALDKAMYLLIAQVVRAEVPLGFFISGKTIQATAFLFAGIFFLVFLNAVRQVQMSNPMELLRAGNVGEKEPKTKWIAAIAGAACVGAGYYLAWATKDPITLVPMFFAAVVLVIIGTYLLFIAGSIALLKALRKNKAYYYKTKHFISVSGMIYRMKQNAVGLANICILSTMVLIAVSSTSTLMLDMEEIGRARYPHDFSIYAKEDSVEKSLEMFGDIRKMQKQMELEVTQDIQYPYLSFSAVREQGAFLAREPFQGADMTDIAILVFVPLEDYNAAMGTEKILGQNEILMYSNRQAFDGSALKIFDREYQVKETLDAFMGNGLIASIIINSHFIVLPDKGELQDLYEKQKEILGDRSNGIQYYYGFDVNADDGEQEAFYDAMIKACEEQEYQATVESRQGSRKDFIGLYSGFFFIGMFLGILFIMATALIIYYKQISEGFDDKERFEIMRNVGLSEQEAKSAIRSQVLTMFFLPPVLAGIHVAAAYPIMTKFLVMLNLLNVQFYMICTMVCFLVFMAMYCFIYVLTARTYFHIVSR